MSDASGRLSVVTEEIIRNALSAAALEMSKTLVRTAYNPLLYEVQDFGLGILSARGELWAEAPGVTDFVGALPDTIRGGLAKVGVDGYAEGDVLIVNDPFLTGSHISDTCVYMPVFYKGKLVAFASGTAHWADIGGKSPGGWCPDSTDVYQEGICFSHQKLVSAGRPNADLWDLIANNVRYPELVRGDLEAQIAACRQGASRVVKLCDKYGPARVEAAMDSVIGRTLASVRRQIAAIPDGCYRAGVWFDHHESHQDIRHRLCVNLDIAGDHLRVGFDGTTPTARGPINLPALGARSAVRGALKGLLLPLDACNQGHLEAIEVDVSPGLLVSAERPAPCDSYGYASIALTELVIQALAGAMPERCPAGTYQLFGAFFFRVESRDGRPFICEDPISGGNGARPHGDGPSIIFLGNGDTPNTPVEVQETRFPLRVERYGFWPSSAGAGRYRGGMGLRRDIRALEPGILMQLAVENTQDLLARGMNGGTDGAPSRAVAWPDTERETTLWERTSYFGPLSPGDIVSIRSGGGGGWGDPLTRDPHQVVDDLRNGLLTPDEAAATYGVVLLPAGRAWQVDGAATAALRTSRGTAGAAGG
jgi:N-methylhydantoinase B